MSERHLSLSIPTGARGRADGGEEHERRGAGGGRKTDADVGIELRGGEARVIAGGLTLRLDVRDGARVTGVMLAGGDDAELVERWWYGYEADGIRWSDAPRADEERFAVEPARVRRGARPEIVARIEAPHVRVEKRFTLYPGLPFIRVRYRSATTGVHGRGPGASLVLPGIAFTDRLVDPFELRQDTADDGMELANGLALPAWRAFADAAGERGLLIFAAERQTMSRLQVRERGCAFRPAYYLAHSTEVVTTRELRLGLQYANFGPVDELDWFVGAFDVASLPAMRRVMGGFHARRRRAGRHEVIEVGPDAGEWTLPPAAALPEPWPARTTLAAGDDARRTFLVNGSGAPVAGDVVTRRGVNVQVSAGATNGAVTVSAQAEPDAAPGVRRIAVPLAGGRLPFEVHVVPAAPLPGGQGQRVIGAAALASRVNMDASGWHVVRRPSLPGGSALVAPPGGGTAAPMRVEPNWDDPVDIYAGLAGGVGLKLKVDGDPYWTYVTADPLVDVQTWQPFDSLCRTDNEVLLRSAVTVGRGLSLAPHPNIQGYTMLTHVRIVPAVMRATASTADGGKNTGGRQFVAGLADTPDVSYELAADSFHPDAWRESIWQHAVHGIDTVYWRIDGQCSDFHTRIGTVRYSIPRTHALYSPVSRYYGQALERLDPLRLAVEESRRWGVRLLGWMRTNAYGGNAVARFFVEHPEWHEEREGGEPSPQLCFAFPEVRAHKIALLCEAAAYGLDGLMIDTLRHPPIVNHAPAVVAAFRQAYGEEPPREPQTRLPMERVDNRTGERWERWFRFRAGYVTQFFRELRAALRVAGLGNLPVHVRVAPRRFLHDGADLEALLAERLVDAIVANRYWTEPLDYEALFPVVAGRVPICAICDPLRNDPIELLLELEREERLAGIGVYESEWSIHTPAHRAVLDQLRARRAGAV